MTRPKSNTDTEQISNKDNEIRDFPSKAASLRIEPHPRTIRKARENVRLMVIDGVSRPKIRSYLYRWLCWWTRTSGGIWENDKLLSWFIVLCRDNASMQVALEVQENYFKRLHTGRMAD